MEINRTHITGWLRDLQDEICTALEQADGKSKFIEENWTRKEGGGGRTRIIGNGSVIEKGGVLFSAVEGDAPEFLFREAQHSNAAAGQPKPQFFATGVSIVIHPGNPLVPIIHMNIRYFEMAGRKKGNGEQEPAVKWLGGGIDLTPHYVVEEDARFFHAELKKVCDRHNPNYYQDFKKWADDYFFISHRNETRGIGGIFFDRLASDTAMSFEQNFSFWKDVGQAFAPIYTKLMKKNASQSFTESQKKWQLLRRGRYVEFNLVYDKGTKFGLETNGRVESILMSLPALAGWEYNHIPEPGSEEEKTQKRLVKGLDWTL
jgi:coproporphyrinogen III oxidase